MAFLIRSLNATVAVPIISLDAVDITAASAAAMMTPRMPIGVNVVVAVAKARSVFSRSGMTITRQMPMMMSATV